MENLEENKIETKNAGGLGKFFAIAGTFIVILIILKWVLDKFL